MQAMPQWYRDIIDTNRRKIDLYIDFGAYIDPTAQPDAVFSGDFTPFSSPLQLFDGNEIDESDFALYEADGIDTAPMRGILMAPKGPILTPQVGVWTGPVGDAAGLMNWTMTITFSSVHSSALTLRFGDVHYVDFDVIHTVAGVETYRDVVRGNDLKVWMSDRGAASYDKMQIVVLKVSEPYRHGRLVELSFGSMVRISTANLVDRSNIVYTKDPLGVTSPPSQIEISLSNIDGAFDIDNPESSFAYLHERNRVMASFRVSDNVTGQQVVIPMGIFFITSTDGQAQTMNVTAQDCRTLIIEPFKATVFTTGANIYDQLAALLFNRSIPFKLDASLQTKTLAAPVTVSEQYSLLSAILYCAQFYEMDVWVDRDGYLNVGHAPSNTYGLLERDHAFNNPQLRKDRQYNALRLLWSETEAYEVDLRIEKEQTALLPLGIDSPFINTQQDAIRVANFLIPRMLKTTPKYIDNMGDPSMDISDKVKMQTRFTRDPAQLPDMMVTEVDYTFTGALRARVTGVY